MLNQKNSNCYSTIEEIKKSDLLKDKGFLIGELEGNLVYDSSYRPVLLNAQTGYGKGVAIVIPNLLSWQESAIIHDLNLENHELTSGYREKELKQKIFVWNPSDKNGESHCYNPLDWLDANSLDPLNETQKIASILIPSNDFYSNEAKLLLTAIVLSLKLDVKKTTSFGEIFKILKTGEISNFFKLTLENFEENLNGFALHYINIFSRKEGKEKDNIASVLMFALKLWSNPAIAKATAKSDFNILDFQKNPTTLYVSASVEDLTQLKTLYQMFYQQCSSLLTSQNRSAIKTGILMILDEFTSIGEIPALESSIQHYRGCKLKLCMIIQNTTQLKYIYGENALNQILNNSSTKITFTAFDCDTAELFSNLIGTKNPEEIKNLSMNEELIIYDNLKIKCNKIMYFERKILADRILKKVDLPK